MKYEYEFMGKKIALKVDQDVVAVRFKKHTPHSIRETTSINAGLGNFRKRIEIYTEKFTIIPVAQTSILRSIRHRDAMRKLKDSKLVKRVAPVFKVGKNRVVATDRILVGFKEKTSEPEAILNKLKCKILQQHNGEYLVHLPGKICPFKVIKQLMAVKKVDYAEPDFVIIGEHLAQHNLEENNADDPLLSQQWAIEKIEARKAWNYQIGDPAIKIAIIDVGVDTSHEDLKDVVVGAYDGFDNDEFQEPKPWEKHGTRCAGLAAAMPNDKGIRGVGCGCSLLAVKAGRKLTEDAILSFPEHVLVNSIKWAWGN